MMVIIIDIAERNFFNLIAFDTLVSEKKNKM